ncbi:MAG: UvrD-helicase domain-containing protein [Planctomycetota bacterium]
MSDPFENLTSEQATALAAHERSVSLAAGAGCGKTFVLTERYLSYLDPRQLQPSAELSELVAITFTDAAAREMRDRIRRRCYDRLQRAEDAAECGAWKQLIATLDGARISTIHAYCATLLRQYAAEAGLDPRFELLDPPTAELLRLRCLDDHLRQLLVASDERLIQLATHFGLRQLRDYVAELLDNSVDELEERWHNATPDELVAHWRENYDTQIAPAALSILATSEPVRGLRQMCNTAAVTTEKFQRRVAQILTLLESFNAHDTPHEATAQLRSLAKVQGVCTKKDWDDPAEFEAYKETCKAVRELVDKSVLSSPLLDEPMQQAAAIGLDLLRLVAQVADRYRSVKQQRNVIEFDDLLVRAHALLTDTRFPQVQQNLARSTQLLMVDEFQDTDPLQVAIVKALRGDQWADQGLFVVGDFKQSIYRFRGAEPRVSSELRATLPVESRLSLTTNFRSQPAVLDFVNALFHDAFAEGYQPLVAHRSQQTPTPAVEFVWSAPTDPSAGDEADRRLGGAVRARMQEARFIARRLSQLLDSNQPMVVDHADDGQPITRPLQLGDIAILLRSLSDVALYEEALREYGLDYYLAGGHAFYAQQEIYDVLHLLRSVASPLDELSLAGVLRSPMFALTDETLFWLVEQSGSLNGGLFSDTLPDALSPADQAKVIRAATTLQQLREQKDHLLVADLLQQAIAATGYDATLLTEFLGTRKWANVQKLIEQARTLDRARPGDLNGFVTQLSEFVVRTPKEPLAATRAEGDVIRIMTIHYAKGLEFPLVVVPDLDRPNYPGGHHPVFDPQLGPLVPAVEKGNLVGWDLHRFVELEQDREERKRLLYVACTRAADFLMLSSSVANLQKPKSDWMKTLGERFHLGDGSLRDSLPPGYRVPEIIVTTSEPATDRKPAGPLRGTDLEQLVAQTHTLAEAGQGEVPEVVAPVAANAAARRRFSFSRLSGELVATTESGDDPSPPTTSPPQQVESNLNPRALGSLVHAVLERVEFAEQIDDLADLCGYLAPQYFDTDCQEAAGDAAALVERFMAGQRRAELAKARAVHREIEFLMPWPTEHADECRYLQGYIDCLYQDQRGDWHVLDYKSNHVAPSSVSQLAEQYALQMFVYGLACRQALGVAPVECVLHFLRPGEEFSFVHDIDTEEIMTRRVDEAIAAQVSAIDPKHN